MLEGHDRLTSSATTDDLRRRNLAALLGLLHVDGPMTRSVIATRMGINRSTVAALVAELAAAGMVREGAGPGGVVGRPSLVVEPVATSAAVFAFDMRVERIVAALVGLGGKVLSSRETRPRGGSLTPAEAVSMLTLLAQEMAEEHPGIPIVGVTVAVPGLVRKGDGMVALAPNLGWHEVPLGDLLAAALSVPFGAPLFVEVGNDADLGVKAEHRRGAGAGARNVVFLSGEVGVGGGIVIDDRVMAGGLGFGGEVGHMVVNPGGKSCRCGARGCWETEIGRASVLSAMGLDGGAGDVPELDDLILGNSPGEPRLAVVADWLGLGLGNLVNIFNPEVLILGGHLRSLHQAMAPVVESRMSQALSVSRRDLRFVYPHFGRGAALMGAAETAFEHLLHDPMAAIAGASRAS